MKYYYYIFLLGCLSMMGLCLSCTRDEMYLSTLTPEQQSLIGKAVNFDASMAEEFATRTSWEHNGKFNDGDLMVIYRQYWDGTKWTKDSYRTYSFDVRYATGTTVSLGRNWKVAVGRWGANWDEGGNKLATPFTQSAADSLTWENGTTVRFRAWSRNNLANYINTGTAETYYPDYCIADWTTVSGPTMGIPLALRHACCRIGFICKEGNQFHSGEICLDAADYKREDNADTNANDTDDKLSDAEAVTVSNEVKDVYNKMCMPAGIDIDDGSLNAMTNSLYNTLKKDKGFKTIEQKTTSDGIVKYNRLPATTIASTGDEGVKRPQFNNIDGRLYMMTIPYDMSNENTHGETLVLPARTRFKIRLRDVNNGDAGNTANYEYKEHIFSLQDITVTEDGVKKAKYPDGLVLTAGKSYLFTVGYQYDHLKVDVIEEGMNWSKEELVPEDLPESIVQGDDKHLPYNWFTEAIDKAIKESKVQGQDYNPIFELSTREEFIEFINLVNGDFPQSGIKRKYREGWVNPEYDKDEDPEYKDIYDPATNFGGTTDKKELQNRKKSYGGYYWWYDEVATATSVAAGGDTVFISKVDAAKRGYVIYNRYFPQLSTQAAHSEETLLTKAYSFYDEQLPLHFVVQLAKDIDMADSKLNTIGNSTKTPFMGYFNGNMCQLSNLYMKDQHLFGYITDGEIINLKIKSTHPTALLKEGTVSASQNLRIGGISLDANSTTNPIAEKLSWESGTTSGRIYVIGCIQYGDAGGALVGKADYMTMWGCMRTASNVRTASNEGAVGGALLGKYGDNSTSQFLDPAEKVEDMSWASTRFLCNYFIKHPALSTRPVGKTKGGADISSAYLPQQYIRGAHDYVLKAKLDNLLEDGAYNLLTDDLMKEEFYGLAPWKAMNYAIARYNQLSVATNHEYKMHNQNHKINAHYQVQGIGYKNLFPQLNREEPAIGDYQDPLKQNN